MPSSFGRFLVAVLALVACSSQPLRAGPITTVITGETAYAVQATLNNAWSASFMAVGTTASASGDSTFRPFGLGGADAAGGEAPATFVAAEVVLAPESSAAQTAGVAGYTSSAGRVDGAGNSRGIVGLSEGPDGFGGLTLEASPGGGPLAGQVDGRNIGTESLAFFGQDNRIPRRLDTTVFWF